MKLALLVALLSLSVGPLAAAPTQAPADQVYTAGDGVTLPVVVTEVKPRYPEESQKANVQGTVTVQCVVTADGSVGRTTVTKSLDPVLDEEAVTAVKQWVFRPGTKDGRPVAVQIAIEMSFTKR